MAEKGKSRGAYNKDIVTRFPLQHVLQKEAEAKRNIYLGGSVKKEGTYAVMKSSRSG